MTTWRNDSLTRTELGAWGPASNLTLQGGAAFLRRENLIRQGLVFRFSWNQNSGFLPNPPTQPLFLDQRRWQIWLPCGELSSMLNPVRDALVSKSTFVSSFGLNLLLLPKLNHLSGSCQVGTLGSWRRGRLTPVSPPRPCRRVSRLSPAIWHLWAAMPLSQGPLTTALSVFQDTSWSWHASKCIFRL